jgi:hypothetical protein
VLVSAASAAYAYLNFARAFPIVSLDLKMTREAALADARRVAADMRLGPPQYREAASFDEDEESQTFVELEGGGKEVFNRMVREGPYFPYVWHVRHFREGEANESTIRFVPAGQPYGFAEKLKEDAPGADIDAVAARAIAERDAARDWGIRFGEYALVENGQEKRPGGRRDHTFVYERPERLGDGRYRLRIVVSGDRLTEVTHFLKVPEAFTRRYEKMRSANQAIGLGSSVAMLLLYIGGGCGIGLFVLLRQRYVLWRPAVAWGVFVAFLQFLVALNEWPLTWMSYDTALSVQSFLLQQLTLALAGFVASAILFAGSFMAAETLTRRAFPWHPQLWKVWSREAAATPAIAARTVAGYLLIPAFFAYDVFLYAYATRRLGWWAPSEALFHPDVLAAYVPWLSAIAQSFQAGFWEESLFRAVPIAGAALIGDRFGHRRPFIVAAFIVQAVVFGAGHAPYPNQPAYARPVELVFPSIVFGLIYFWYGLLPGIVLHFGFDLTFFALPLFVASAPGIWIQRAMILLLGLVPIWLVLLGRWRVGRWVPLSPAMLNGGWRPPDVIPAPVPVEAPRPAAPAATVRLARMLLAVTALLVAGLMVFSPVRDAPTLDVGRGGALQVSRDTLEARRQPIARPWTLLTQLEGTPTEEHAFVRLTAGDNMYAALLGRYLWPPRWVIRDVTFEGDVVERAEEWDVVVYPDGSARRFRHTLPESRSAPSLDETAARQLARATAVHEFAIDDRALREVSAAPQKLPARTDWQFTFEDTGTPLPQGQARLTIVIGGAEIADAFRFVYVPEEWSRAQRSRVAILGAVRLIGVAVLALVAAGGAVAAIVAWSRKRFEASVFFRVASLVFVAAGLSAANAWPLAQGRFVTAAPYLLQAMAVVVSGLVVCLAEAGATGLLAGLIVRWAADSSAFDRRTAMMFGVGLGLAGSALGTGVLHLPGAAVVGWPGFDQAGTFLPVLALMLAPIAQFALTTALLGFVFGGVNIATRGWTRHRIGFMAALALFGMAAGVLRANALWVGLPAVLVTAVLYAGFFLAASRWVLRFDLSPIPVAVGTLLVMESTKGAWMHPFPGSAAGYVLAALVACALAWWWTRLATPVTIPSGRRRSLGASSPRYGIPD